MECETPVAYPRGFGSTRGSDGVSVFRREDRKRNFVAARQTQEEREKESTEKSQGAVKKQSFLSTMSIIRWLAVALICAGPILDGSARQISYGTRAKPRQGIGIAYLQTEFTFEGVCVPGESPDSCALDNGIDFSEPAYAIIFSRPGLMMSIARGTGDGSDALVEGEELIDASLSAWTELRPFGFSGSLRTGVFIPAGIHTSYRKFTRERDGGTVDEFESTVVGIGAGLGAEMGSGRFRFSARGLPIIGLASRSAGFGKGYSTVVEADVEVAYGPVSGRIGLLAGYGFRWQKWDLDDAGVSAVQSDQVYSGTQHGLRLGVTW